MFFIRIIVLVAVFLLPDLLFAAPVTKYLAKAQQYNKAIPTPSQVLGFGIGERHIHHAQLVNYFQKLQQESSRVNITTMGLTNQYRPQLLVTISSPENLANLPEILASRKNPERKSPLVIWLGYSVHGDEISGANASLLVAYHLAASQNEAVKSLLENTLIVIEPSINPDGMERFVGWVENHHNKTPNADPNHIEHHQGWLTGRTNHYGFDLNRDWLLLSQQESQHRLKYFHLYQPNVLADFHEMGANSSYFFQPGIPSRTHPLTPKKNIDLTKTLATYHAKALDKNNRLYFSEESYDDFYYGKGSTYPDINGAVGILFEQASSRGYQQQTDNGLLTFEFSIQNHVLTSLSTIEGAWQNRQQLAQYRQSFYQQALKEATKENVNGYLLHEENDPYRLEAFLNKLKQHQIKVYPLAKDFRHQGTIYRAQTSFYVPLAQPQYRVIKALFNQQTHFKDNTFYDVSGWTMPLAMNITFKKVERTWGLKLAEQPWQASVVKHNSKINPNAYAYVVEWQHFLAPKLLNELLSQGIKVRVANKAFANQEKLFAAGSLLIPAGIQTTKAWREIITKASLANNIPLFSLKTGLTVKGIDLGSRSFIDLKPVNILLLGGKGISQYEAGEMLFYLDEMLNIPVSVVEYQRIASIDLSTYSHIILVDGNYRALPSELATKVAQWIKNGGTVIAQKRAAKWLADKGILKVDFVNQNSIKQLFTTDDLRYQDKEKLAAKQRIAGAIFATNIDLSHPLSYGYQLPHVPLFKNSTLVIEQLSQPFITVASYQEQPLLSGYSDEKLVSTIANSPAIVAHNFKQGRVIAMPDDTVFRGYWLGSAKIIANSLFFSKAFNTPLRDY
jgi:hypothetical protein